MPVHMNTLAVLVPAAHVTAIYHLRQSVYKTILFRKSSFFALMLCVFFSLSELTFFPEYRMTVGVTRVTAAPFTRFVASCLASSKQFISTKLSIVHALRD